MLNKQNGLLLAIAIILVVLMSSCSTTAPPSIEFCQHRFSSGMPTAIVLLDPGGAPIADITVASDRWELASNPPSLVKEASIYELDGQIWQRADPVAPDEWWTPISQEEWAADPLDSLVAVTLQWPFSPPLAADEKLVYQLRLKYLTPQGNYLLNNSDTQAITSNADDLLTDMSEMCQDFLAFSISG